jgi:uncharacterized repeat protein (TIGR01451 family)
MRKVIQAVLAAVVLPFVLSAVPAASQQAKDQAQLSVAMTVAKEARTVVNGKETVSLVPAEKTKKGDVLVYTITYANKQKGGVQGVMLVGPVPAKTVYMPGSAEGKGAMIKYSVDGGKTFNKPPVKWKVKLKDGTTGEETAPPDRYTHVKWEISKRVMPGQSGRVSYKVVVK